jgi:hypothetical protein
VKVKEICTFDIAGKQNFIFIALGELHWISPGTSRPVVRLSRQIKPYAVGNQVFTGEQNFQVKETEVFTISSYTGITITIVLTAE